MNSTQKYLEALLADTRFVELRHFHPYIESGFFNNLDDLRRCIVQRRSAGNLYTSLNSPFPCDVPNTMGIRALKNADIETIVRIPFDFDPVRAKDTCSTSAELAAARESALRLWRVLDCVGWPQPLIAISGNGYHLQYRTRLPSTRETVDQFETIYGGLEKDFSTDEISFDVKVRNPCRILRLYGAVNRKGPNTKDRPHRLATCQIPDSWRRVDRRLIDRLANRYARQQPKPLEARRQKHYQPISGVKGNYSTLDIVSWFSAHGAYLHPIVDSKHAVICPWAYEHSAKSPPNGGDTIIYESDGGWPGFYCHHAHCEGRGIRDVLSLWSDAAGYCNAVA